MKLYHIFAEEQSTLTIPDYARAKKRRDLTSPLFSRKSVLDLQHRIQDCVSTVPHPLTHNAHRALTD